MAGFSLDVAAISVFTVLAVLLASWWLYKKLSKKLVNVGDETLVKSRICPNISDAVVVKDFYEFRRIISRQENEGFSPVAIHGKDTNLCQSKLWDEGTGSNILRKYIVEIVSQNSENLKDAMQEAVEKLLNTIESKYDNEIQDITENLFLAVFTEMQLILLGNLDDLKLEENLNQMQKHLQSVIELWPTYSLEGTKLERSQKDEQESEIENCKQKLLDSIIHVIKRKSDTRLEAKNEAYADYILNSCGTENKDALKFVANHISDLLVLSTDALFRVLISGVMGLLDNFRVQERVFDEILKFNGHRLITTELLENKSSFPLTRAVVQEVIRLTPMPAAIFRRNQGENLDMEKNETCNDVIAADLRSMLTDPEIWKNPNSFDPDRFLDPLRKNLLQKEEYIPFCTGDRSCPAESLVETTLFVVIASLVQKFHLKKPATSDGLQEDGSETAKQKAEPRVRLIVKSRSASEKQP